jgi:peptidoglycan/LPS O-acetylase OafA/YrhL
MQLRGAKGANDRSTNLVGIQILRAIAAILVVMHHALEESLGAVAEPKAPDWLVTFGAAGVDIFFVISGFIMFYVSFPADRPAVSPTSFLRKRIARIYPFYWLCVAFFLCLKSIGLFHGLHLDADILIRSFLLLPSSHLVIGVAWTLVYEMYFYLIFATSLFFGRPLVSLMLPTAVIFSLCAAGRFTHNTTLHNFLGNAIAVEFCFGLALGYTFRRPQKPNAVSRFLWIPGFALLAFAPLVVAHANTNGLPDTVRVLAWGLPSVLVVLSFLSPNGDRAFRLRPLAFVGDASYATYLTHPIIMIAYATLLKGSLGVRPQYWVVPFVVMVSVATGLLAHVFVERRLIASAKIRL